MKNHQALNTDEIFASPAIVWRGMSFAEIESEIQALKRRQQIINQFVFHLTHNSVCDLNQFEKFCDLISSEGVDPDLWIGGVIENIELTTSD
jgi:hypothetical protein